MDLLALASDPRSLECEAVKEVVIFYVNTHIFVFSSTGGVWAERGSADD